jgi:hypothetical protein
MDFVRSYFGTDEPLTSWPDLCTQQNQSKSEEKCSYGQRFICTEVTSYKIHILDICWQDLYTKALVLAIPTVLEIF